MNELTIEEKIKVFGLYAGCKVSANNSNPPTLTFGNTDSDNLNIIDAVNLGTYQMILRPLSDIEDDHKITLLTIEGYTDIDTFELEYNLRQFEFRTRFRRGKIPCSIFQQLITWGYAVPLHFGYNHWANGLTAIDLNLAKQPS